MSDEHKSDVFSWTTKWIIVGGAAAAVAVVGAFFAFKYRKDHFTGVGRKQYADGSLYEGDMVDGKAHGRGCLSWVKGKTVDVVCDGQFVNDLLNGQIRIEYRKGGVVFEGAVVSTAPGSKIDGPFQAHCIYDGVMSMPEDTNSWMKIKGLIDPDSEIPCADVEISTNGVVSYKGGVSRSGSHGKDCFKMFPDGSVYRGDFIHGEMEGFGRLEHPNGDVYEGIFGAGKKHGQGKMTFANGSIFSGSWVDGLWEDGTLSFPNKPSKTIISGKVVG